MANMFSMKQIYLNGQFLPPQEAAISVFDRGFVFGDGVYEVIPVFGKRLFRLPHHLARLQISLAAIRLSNPLSEREWGDMLTRLIAAESANDQSVYLQVTRGVAPRDHAFPPDTKPTVFAYAQPLTYPSNEQLAQGVSAITIPDNRWHRCDIKSIALLANALLRQEAIDANAAEAILVRDGCVTEGAASNIFMVRGGHLVTPPKGPGILAGITRDLVLELARAHGISCAEDTIREPELERAEEIWMTSSTKEIMPITRLNRKPVGEGRPGQLHGRLLALYREYKQDFCAGRVE